MKKLLSLLTWADRVLLLVLLVATTSSYAWVKGIQTHAAAAVITVNDVEVARYPLDYDRESIKIAGTLGEAELQIQGGRIRVIAAPCPNKMCVGIGWIHKSGELIACVPNRMVLSVTGEKAGGGLDGITR